MICSKCSSDKVSVQMVQTAAVSNTKKKGILFALGRLTLIIGTAGLWLVFGKKKAKTKTSFKHEKTAVCGNCGHSWAV